MGTAAVIGGGALLGGLGSAWSQKKASEASAAGQRKALQSTEAATAQARSDVNALFPSARASATQGYQNALDMLAGTMPLQTSVFQQGNVGAQQAILAGLPQMQNAILGNQVDYSAFQPQSINFDTSQFLAGIPNLKQQAAQQIVPTLNVGANTPTSMSMPQIAAALPLQILSNPQYLNSVRGLVK